MKSAPTVAVPYARRLSGGQAWSVIFGFVFLHEMTCREEQLLSEAVDRGLERHPYLTYSLFAVTVAHLLNRLPNKLDPYWWVWKVTKGNV